jgi:uncharacterized protein YjbI with pentapeptide repeats
MDPADRRPPSLVVHDARIAGPVAIDAPTEFERCVFAGANLQSADLTDCRFVECRFEGSNLSVARVPGCVLQDVTFRDTKLVGIDWSVVARFSVVAFERCVLDQCAFVKMDLHKCVLRGSRLREAVFDGTDLSEADLRDTDLAGARFNGTKLVKADLRGARNYVIHPVANQVTGLRASMPDAVGLVAGLGVEIEL